MQSMVAGAERREGALAGAERGSGHAAAAAARTDGRWFSQLCCMLVAISATRSASPASRTSVKNDLLLARWIPVRSLVTTIRVVAWRVF